MPWIREGASRGMRGLACLQGQTAVPQPCCYGAMVLAQRKHWEQMKRLAAAEERPTLHSCLRWGIPLEQCVDWVLCGQACGRPLAVLGDATGSACTCQGR